MRKKSIVFTAMMLGLGMLYFSFMSSADDSKKKSDDGISSFLAPMEPVKIGNNTVAPDDNGNENQIIHDLQGFLDEHANRNDSIGAQVGQDNTISAKVEGNAGGQHIGGEVGTDAGVSGKVEGNAVGCDAPPET